MTFAKAGNHFFKAMPMTTMINPLSMLANQNLAATTTMPNIGMTNSVDNNATQQLLTLILQLLQALQGQGNTTNTNGTTTTSINIDANSFNQAAGADKTLQPTELQALTTQYAGVDQSFNQAEFMAFAKALGIDDSTALAIFNAKAQNGQVPASTISNLGNGANLDLNGLVQALSTLLPTPTPAPTPAVTNTPIVTTNPNGDSVTVQTGNGADNAITNGGNDTINAGAGNDVINAGDGNDTIDAGNGDDVINAGPGNDTIVGGEGNDVFVAGQGDTIVIPGAGAFLINNGQFTAVNMPTNLPNFTNQTFPTITTNTETTIQSIIDALAQATANLPATLQPLAPPAPVLPAPIAPIAPAPVPAPIAPVAVKPNATVWGDPHFKGAEGDTFDIKGDDNKVYNLLSDKGVQVNSTFKGNLMQDYGVTVGNNQISFDKAGNLSINGETVKGNGQFLDGMVERKGNTVKINAGEYNLDLITNSSYMDIKFASDNVAADGIMPHGLWGQTADGDGKARTGTDTDGSGAIERAEGGMAKAGDKTYKQYEVNGLFDTGFANFNRFNGTTTQPVVAVAANGEGA